MKRRKLLASSALSLAIAASASAATTSVFTPNMAGEVELILDIDGDGIADLNTFVAGAVTLEVDLPSAVTMPSGALPQFGSFASYSVLLNWPGYSGTASIGSGATRSSPVGYFMAEPDLATSPIMVGWQFGTSGEIGSDPYFLIGYVIDARDYAIDDRSAITVYHHNYGPLLAGDSMLVSLLDTGAPIPEPGTGFLVLVAAGALLLRRRD